MWNLFNRLHLENKHPQWKQCRSLGLFRDGWDPCHHFSFPEAGAQAWIRNTNWDGKRNIKSVEEWPQHSTQQRSLRRWERNMVELCDTFDDSATADIARENIIAKHLIQPPKLLGTDSCAANKTSRRSASGLRSAADLRAMHVETRLNSNTTRWFEVFLKRGEITSRGTLTSVASGKPKKFAKTVLTSNGRCNLYQVRHRDAAPCILSICQKLD